MVREELHSHIHKLILQIRDEEQIPNEWKENIIIPIHKKVDKHKCAN